jgi:hypothetical protein
MFEADLPVVSNLLCLPICMRIVVGIGVNSGNSNTSQRALRGSVPSLTRSLGCPLFGLSTVAGRGERSQS